jgi:hypothetical protein
MRFRLCRHTLIVMGLLGSPCFGDTVWLTNGDRITGEITEISSSTLKIKTSYAATLSLDTSAVRSFATDSAHRLQIDLKPHTAQIQESDAQGQVIIDGKQIAIHHLKLVPDHGRWKKSALLETTLDVDNDHDRKENFHINGELHLESDTWRHELNAEVKRDKENHRLTEDTEEYSYSLDYLFNEHWLLRTDSFYRAEGTTLHHYYTYAGTGPGYRLWGEDRDKLDFIVAYRRFWFKVQTIDIEMDAVSANLDYQQFWFDDKLETFADLEVSHMDLHGLDYIFNSNLGLRLYITHHLHISFKYDYNKTRYSFGSIKDSSYILGAGVNL